MIYRYNLIFHTKVQEINFWALHLEDLFALHYMVELGVYHDGTHQQRCTLIQSSSNTNAWPMCSITVNLNTKVLIHGNTLILSAFCFLPSVLLNYIICVNSRPSRYINFELDIDVPYSCAHIFTEHLYPKTTHQFVQHLRENLSGTG